MTTAFKVPFGQYRGRDIEDVPDSYLRWVVDTVDNNDEFVEAAEDELRYRSDHGCHVE